MDGIANHFSASNALDCKIVRIQSQNVFPRLILPSKSDPPVLGPRHQFPLGSPAFPLFLFYETTTGPVLSPCTTIALSGRSAPKTEANFVVTVQILTLPCVTRLWLQNNNNNNNNNTKFI